MTALGRRYYNKVVKSRLHKIVNEINSLKDKVGLLSDIELREIWNQESISKTNSAMPLAILCEASKRALGMEYHPVQIMGGVALSKNRIIEMATGEGKTLVATIPASIKAGEGHRVHIITANEYLAARDAETLKPLYDLLGISVGVNLSCLSHEEKREVYRCSIIYGTASEFGFDFLRENLVKKYDQKLGCKFEFALIDEVDSILIDEARTPLIITDHAKGNNSIYQLADAIATQLQYSSKEGTKHKATTLTDVITDVVRMKVTITESGYENIEKELSIRTGIDISKLYHSSHLHIIIAVQNAITAHGIYHKDQHYLVSNGLVVLIDENTGRLMDGRRLSDGLHQALEAKECVDIQSDSVTVAEITYQYFFRNYSEVCGMTGTAMTDKDEFKEVYGLNVISIPRNIPNKRIDEPDKFFLDEKSKMNAILQDISECHGRGQPVLIGTTTIEKSQQLSELLRERDLPHYVLNAKHHEQEAEIIASAGKPHQITISTNMAGRGTDIILGGTKGQQSETSAHEDWPARNRFVVDQGGLRVIGTERNESRRIDNQLIGRAGRQGDPGSSVFYLCADDPMFVNMGMNKLKAIFSFLAKSPSEAISHPSINKGVINAQKQLEGMGFDARKALIKFDAIIDKQRSALYALRDEWLNYSDYYPPIQSMLTGEIEQLTQHTVSEKLFPEQWALEQLEKDIEARFGLKVGICATLDDIDTVTVSKIRDEINHQILTAVDTASKIPPGQVFNDVVRDILIQHLDLAWSDHLRELHLLKRHIHLRIYAQKQPGLEFQLEAYNLFKNMLLELRTAVASYYVRSAISIKRHLEKAIEARKENTPQLNKT